MIEITCARCKKIIEHYEELTLIYLNERDVPRPIHMSCERAGDVHMYVMHAKDMGDGDILLLVYNMLEFGEQRKQLQQDVWEKNVALEFAREEIDRLTNERDKLQRRVNSMRSAMSGVLLSETEDGTA